MQVQRARGLSRPPRVLQLAMVAGADDQRLAVGHGQSVKRQSSWQLLAAHTVPYRSACCQDNDLMACILQELSASSHRHAVAVYAQAHIECAHAAQYSGHLKTTASTSPCMMQIMHGTVRQQGHTGPQTTAYGWPGVPGCGNKCGLYWLHHIAATLVGLGVAMP